MNCVDDSLIQMLVEGELDEAEQELVHIHLRRCIACRQKVSGYKELMWDLSQDRQDALPAELDDMQTRLMAAWADLQREQRSQGRASQSLVPSWAGYTVNWARHVPPVERVGGLLSKAGSKLGSKLIETKLPFRRVRGKGGRR